MTFLKVKDGFGLKLYAMFVVKGSPFNSFYRLYMGRHGVSVNVRVAEGPLWVPKTAPFTF